MILCSLFGNIFVIYGSYQFRSFRMGRITVAFIRHISICNVSFVIVPVIPMLISKLHHSWCFGKFLCYIQIYVECCIASAHFKLIFFISLHRLLRCIKPHQTSKLTRTHATVIVTIAWVVSFSEVLLSAATTLDMDKYDILTANHCTSLLIFSSTLTTILGAVQFIFSLLIPFAGTIFSNSLLWIFTCSQTMRFNYKPLLTVSVMSGQIIIAWLPIITLIIMVEFSNNVKGYLTLETIAFNLHLISIVTNPMIYTIFNRPFAKFIKVKLKGLWQICTCNVPVMNDSVQYTRPEENAHDRSSNMFTQLYPSISSLQNAYNNIKSQIVNMA